MELKAVISTEVQTRMPVHEGFIPTEAEVRLLRVLMDHEFMLSNPGVGKICEAADVASIQTFYTAMKKTGFIKTIQMYAVDPCKGKAKKYIQWLEDHAERGSWPHLKALLAITGIYDEKLTVEIEPVKTLVRPGRNIEDIVVE